MKELVSCVTFFWRREAFCCEKMSRSHGEDEQIVCQVMHKSAVKLEANIR